MQIHVSVDNTVTMFYEHLLDHLQRDTEIGCTEEDIKFMFKPKPTTTVSQKQQKLLITRTKQILQDETFYKSMHTHEHAINTLKDMIEEGLDVRLIFPLTYDLFLVKPVSQHEYASVPTTVTPPTDARIAWINKVFGKVWLDRVIFANASSYAHLTCDTLITSHSIPNTTGTSLLFGSNEFPHWKEWRTHLHGVTFQKPISQVTVPFFRHGSPNSVDTDLIYLFPQKPDPKVAKDFLKDGEKLDQDRNIITIKDGIVNYCYIGIIDSVNNALLTTYSMHEQQFELPIMHRIKRVVAMKVNETLLHVLVKLRKIPSIRERVVQAIQSYDFHFRKTTVSELDITKLDLDADTIKTLTFRFCQTIALMNGIECFTKDVTIEQFPDIKSLLYRQVPKEPILHLEIVTKYQKMFIEMIQGVNVTSVGDLHLYTLQDQVTNWFHEQCNGLIVDYRYELLRYYPLDNKVKRGTTTWPEDEYSDQRSEETISVFEYEPSKGSTLPKCSIKLGNKYYIICSNKSFDTEAAKHAHNLLSDNNNQLMKQFVQSYSFSEYYYVFDQNLNLIANRNVLTNLL